MDFLHALMPKTEVLNQATESLDSATEEMNGATEEPDHGAKIMDASAKRLDQKTENLDVDSWRMPRSLGFTHGKSGFHPRIFLDIAHKQTQPSLSGKTYLINVSGKDKKLVEALGFGGRFSGSRSQPLDEAGLPPGWGVIPQPRRNFPRLATLNKIGYSNSYCLDLC